jgi:hypothetical protein
MRRENEGTRTWTRRIGHLPILLGFALPTLFIVTVFAFVLSAAFYAGERTARALAFWFR